MGIRLPLLAALALCTPLLAGAAPAEMPPPEAPFAASSRGAPSPLDTMLPAAPEGIPDWRVPPESRRSRSVGAPNDGRLEHGVPLPLEGPGFVRFDRDSHYGTDETIALIEYAAARLALAFPGTAPMLVGAISREEGGKLPHHRSHRTGRDVDIAFFERGNVGRTLFNEALTADDVDYAKSWFVLEALITTGRVEYVFADHSLHAGLMAAAREAGWDEDTLDAFFLLEDESGYRGIIRHAPGHLAHFHVRFRCPEGDGDCESY